MRKVADADTQQLARILHEPMMELPVVPIVPKPTPVSFWHWWHAYSVWGAVFSANSAGFLGAFTGGMSGPWWQERSCVRCNHSQRRRVEMRNDR